MSLPYSAIVSISGVVQSPDFVTEKKHMLLAVTSSLIPTSASYLEFSGAGAVASFGAYFGTSIPEYTQLQKYFGFLSKGGNAPEKVVVARWYNTDTAAFIKGAKVTASVASIAAVTAGSLNISLDGTAKDITGIDFSSATSYSDVATILQTALQTDFAGATVAYNSTTGGYIITSATTGSTSATGGVKAAASGTDVSAMLGLASAELSQGVDAETYAQFCDRIYQANTAGYSITTLNALTNDEITAAVQWLQTAMNGQTYNTAVRLVFDLSDLATAKTLSASLDSAGYTGYVLCYDPNGEYINVLDCAIAATIDYDVANGAINFNFQPATGYTAITTLGSVVDYQSGKTNVALMEDLNDNYLSTVYSVGFGSQEETYYGFGLMAGDFGSEDIQINESALEQAIQVSILNGMTSLNKVPLRGTDASLLVGSLLTAPLEQFKVNGSIATNGTLTTLERASIAQATGNANAADAVEQTGYFYKVYDLTEADIAARQVRVLICYLASGVLNRVRIINKVYGA